MVPKPALSPPAMRDLKLVLAVSGSYYAKILPSYRKSLECRRFRCAKVKNPKGLRIKIYPTWHVAVASVLPRVHASPQSNANSLKRPASPVESNVGPPSKKFKSRKLADATTADTRLLNLMPLLKRLQGSLILPSHIVLSKGRWLIIKQRESVRLDEPSEFPEDLVTIKVPPRLGISRRTSKI